MSHLSTVINDLNKKFGNIISVGIPEEWKSYDRIPFSSPRLNYMLYGGIPRGRLIEFAGEENSGKTTSALDFVSNAQQVFEKEYQEELSDLESLSKRNKTQEERYQFLKERGPLKCLFLDCENTLDEEWATTLNVDLESLVVVKPEDQSAEELFDLAIELMKTKSFGVVVIDSLGVMVSQAAFDESIEKKTYGGISIPLTTFSKKAVQLCKSLNIILLGINQLRDKINSPVGGKDTTGGRAWKHNCSLRLYFNKGEYIDDSGKGLTRGAENPAGNIVSVSIQKTKVCRANRRTGFYTLNYTYGIDWISDLVDVAEKFGFLEKRGAWYNFVNVETGEIMSDENGEPIKLQGKNNVIAFLESQENEEILQELEENVDKKIRA